MPLRYDAAVKTLIERFPADWLERLGTASGGKISVMDADLSVVSADADMVLYRELPRPSIVNLELQTSSNPKLGIRTAKYAILLHERHELPVHSVVVLLRRQADHPTLTGTVGYDTEDGSSLDFRHPVARKGIQ